MCGLIAIATESSNGKQSVVDSRFGCAGGYLIIDADSREVVTYIENSPDNAPKLRGIAAVLKLNKYHVDSVISGRLGTKSGAQLESLAIKAWIAPDGITAEEALELFRSGALIRKEDIFV